jgi:hypothetical protein
VPRSGALAAAVVCVGLSAGCGNTRTPVPSLTRPETGGTLRSFSYQSDGLSFSAPQSWTVFAAPPPLVTVLASGGAVVSVWRYPLSGRAPSGAAQLEAARRGLIAVARRRDPSLRVLGTKLLRIDGAPAVRLDAIERVSGQLRRSLATHVYLRHAELVFDEYAPVALFGAVDRGVFSRLNRSLVISDSA